MKLQIIQLDPHDDAVSVGDKLKWAKADRVLLVWPRRGRLLRRRFDLVLLRRKARARGLQLGLLTHDPQVRDLAADLQLAVFDNSDNLPEGVWSQPDPQPAPWPARRPVPLAPPDTPSRRSSKRLLPPWARWSLFALGLLSVLSIAFVLAPSATILITPARQLHEGQTSFVLDPLESGERRLAAVQLAVEVEHSGRIGASGQQSFPGQTAGGQVTFTNLGDDPVLIPEATSLRSSQSTSPRFLTTAPVTVPAGQGSQVQVDAVAADGGPAGNLPAGAIDAIDGPLGLATSVTNLSALAGGTNQLETVVAEADLTVLRRRLLAEMLPLALDRLADQAPQGMLFLEQSVVQTKLNELAYDRQAGERAASVGLELAVTFQAWAVDREELAAALDQAAARLSTSDQSIVPGSAALNSLAFEPAETGLPSIVVSLLWESYQPLEPNRLSALVVGQPAQAARLRLESAYPAQEIDIAIWPEWLERLPWVTARIEVGTVWGPG